MSTSWLITNIVSALFLPPLNLVVPGMVGLMLRN
jgi:hypothetical protein